MVLNKRNIKAVLDGVDISEKVRSPSADTNLFELTAASSFYVGYHEKFASRFFYLTQPSVVNSVNVSVKYYNGTSYVAVSDLADQTSGFKKSGFLSWVNECDWEKSVVSPIAEELYWVKIEVSASLTAGTTIQAILNLFSDDNMLKSYYPSIVSDTRYLPPNRTDFIEQHEAAKNKVVTRLVQKKIITDESQIIDVNQVVEAAVHACANIILAPIAQSEFQNQLVQSSNQSFENAISNVNLGIDLNKDGIVTEGERAVINTGLLVRR